MVDIQIRYRRAKKAPNTIPHRQRRAETKQRRTIQRKFEIPKLIDNKQSRYYSVLIKTEKRFPRPKHLWKRVSKMGRTNAGIKNNAKFQKRQKTPPLMGADDKNVHFLMEEKRRVKNL